MSQFSIKKTVLSAAISAAAVTALLSGGAQAITEDGTAKVKVIIPISLSSIQDMNFGTVAPGISDGSIDLSAAGVTTEVDTAVSFDGEAQGIFRVTGAKGQAYLFSISPTATLTKEGGSETLTINNFVHNHAGFTGMINAITGVDTIHIGATLLLPSVTVAGDYTGTYTVTVLYP